MSTDRYARQTVLEEIGSTGQNRLARARVLVVGAGGLGCPALQYLAAAGIGHIGIADFDRVEESNLHRQILFTMDQIGTNKAAAARDRLRALNPEIKITIYEDGLHENNAENLFTAHDIIIDGTDNFAAKYLINDAGVKFQKPVIYGALNKFEGQIAVFDPARGSSCYRCLHPHEPSHHVPNCAQAGIIGAAAGITGTTQAMETIKIIAAHESFKPLYGALFCIDMRDMRARTLAIPKNPHCPVCAKNPADIALPKISKQENCTMIRPISVAEARNETAAVFIDVREQDEWDAGHIEGAQFLPLSQLMEGNVPTLPHDKTLLLYCKSGQRSLYAAQILQARGYENVLNLTGGYLAWAQDAA